MHPNDYWTTFGSKPLCMAIISIFFSTIFFYPVNKKIPSTFIAALKIGAFGIKCANYCRLHYYNNKLWFCLVFLFDNWRKSFKIFADLSVAPKTLLIVIDEYDEEREKKVCKSGSCNNLRNAIWNYFYTKNRQKQGWSECNKCTTFFI